MNRIACPVVVAVLIGAAGLFISPGLFVSSGLAEPAAAVRGPGAKKVADRNDIAVTLSGELPGDWFEQLKSLPNLEKVTLRHPTLQNLKVAQFRELKSLTEFSAEDFSIESRLADIVAMNIAQLPRLKSVQFHRTGLTGRGLQALSRSPTAELVLDGEELLTDADYQHVATMPSLNRLVMDSTPIDSDGLKALQAAPGLRRLALRRHPAGSNAEGCVARVNAIAGFEKLEELELGDTGYSQLVPLKACKTLRLLTLRNCGGTDALNSLKQLTQLKRIEFDDSDLWKESFDDLLPKLAEIGIAFADVTQQATDLLARSTAPADEATLLARQALEDLDVGRTFPSFWIEWRQHWSKIPTMTAEPIRTIHRLRRALTAENEKQPWEQATTFAYAPGQFFMRNLSMEGDIPKWQQTTFGDAKLAWSREGQTEQPFMHILRSGAAEFEESLGHHFPRQLNITHQHLWWGTPTHHNSTSSPISPQKVAYLELPAETFAGETCRVFEASGRSERLWVSQSTRRLRGSLHYIHQGYFTPFYKQDFVTKTVGRRVQSLDDYRSLLSEPGAVSIEAKNQLSQAWSEYEFGRGYPGTLVVLDDYREIAAGKWFPFKVTSSGWHHNEKNEGQYGFNVSENHVKEVVIDRGDLEPYWAEFLPKSGDKIQDQRYGASVDYRFDSDRTEDDIQNLVNEQLLTFARSAIQIEIAQSPFTKMIGKPAPQLSTEGWIGERPELTGKRYLLHFWATWCGPCKNDVPLLNSLAKDRIVIGVHPADTPVDQVGESVKNSKMAYPTVVAPHGSKDVLGYPVKMFPYCVEVDEQGNVAKHGFLSEVLGVRPRNHETANQPPANQSIKASGTVLAIDGKDGLSVISAGEVDGIQSNQILDVTREGKSVAQIRVVLVRKNRCVGKTIDQSEQATITIGDNVVSVAIMPGP